MCRSDHCQNFIYLVENVSNFKGRFLIVLPNTGEVISFLAADSVVDPVRKFYGDF